MKRTNQEIRMNFKGYDIVIPKGTRITHQTALGIDENYNFIDDLSFIDKKQWPLLYHDAFYYGITVDKSQVEES
jgi:hypothetical protein